MLYFSNLNGKPYHAEECVYFRNCKQVAKYLNWGATLVDLFSDKNNTLVFVFTKKDHNKFKQQWIDGGNNE